jgi:hypothetical protein
MNNPLQNENSHFLYLNREGRWLGISWSGLELRGDGSLGLIRLPALEGDLPSELERLQKDEQHETAERDEVPPPPEASPAQLENPQDAWWARMMEHCNNAYEGGLTLEPPGDDMLRGDELLLVHFRGCSETELRLPFHIEAEPGEWNRSRTWIFTRHEDRIELRHDHRHEDGTPEDNTFYGGFTQDEGTPVRQVFIFTDYDEYTDAGPHRGWRVDIEPHSRYTYGTFRGDDWRWRVDFDLSQPGAPPPAPWGHE